MHVSRRDASVLAAALFVLLISAVHAKDLGVCHADCTRECYGAAHQCGDEDGVETYFEHCCSCGGGTRSVGEKWNECLPGTSIEAEYRCVSADLRDPHEGMPEFTGTIAFDSPHCECDPSETRCVEEGDSTYQKCSTTWRWEARECDEDEVCSSADGTARCVRACTPRSTCINKANREYIGRDCVPHTEECRYGCVTENGAGACRQSYAWPAPASGRDAISTCFSEVVCVCGPPGHLRPCRPSEKGSCSVHTGTDIAGRTGDAIVAMAAGAASVAADASGYGNNVLIRHDDGWYSFYAHLARASVRSGQRVDAGDEIGVMDTTGRSTGPHLHVEIRRTKDGGLEDACTHTDCGGSDCTSAPGPQGGAPEAINNVVADECKAACTSSGRPLGNRRDLCSGYAKYKPYVDRAAARFGIDPAALLAVASAQSGLAHYDDSGRVAASGGLGVMHISSAARLCASRGWISDAGSVANAEENIECGAGYLAEQLHICGTIEKAYGNYLRPSSRCTPDAAIAWFYGGWKQCLRAMDDAGAVRAGFREELDGYRDRAVHIKSQITELLAGNLSADERTQWEQAGAGIDGLGALIDEDISYMASNPPPDEAAAAMARMRNDLIGRLDV